MTTPTVEELAAQVETLTMALAALADAGLPEVTPGWGVRTCQVCGELAQVIDVSPETRATARNGEGYCLKHAKTAGVLDRKHLKRR